MNVRSLGPILVACHDCGQVHRVPELSEGAAAICSRCGGVLVRHRSASSEHALALSIAGLAPFGVANLFPLMTLKLADRE